LQGLSAAAIPDGGLISDRCCAVSLAAYVSGVHFVDGAIAAALGDGTVRFMVPANAGLTTISVHAGAILHSCTAHDECALLTGGDDGRVCRVTPGGVEALAEHEQWIDALACHPGGAYGFASGKTATIRRPDGSERKIAASSTVNAIAPISPTGFALAHHGGLTLIDFSDDRIPVRLLAGAGAHVAVTESPFHHRCDTQQYAPRLAAE
jgi:hypothetical protein